MYHVWGELCARRTYVCMHACQGLQSFAPSLPSSSVLKPVTVLLVLMRFLVKAFPGWEYGPEPVL